MDIQLGLFTGDPEPRGPRSVGPARPSPEVGDIAERLPRALRLGTSSWSFPGWAGIVYDRPATASTLARDGLEAYAAHPFLRTVGLDRTYYRPLEAREYRSYAEVVPEDFRFLVKMDRRLTSPLDPGDGSFRGRNPHFLDAGLAVEEVVGPTIEGLGAKAGPLLFQFSPIPPNLVGGPEAFADRLHRFLADLPVGPTYATELRTPALLTPSYVKALEDAGACHGYVVHPAMSSLERQLDLLRPFEQPTLVVRWMLHAGLRYEAAKDRYDPFDRIVDRDPDSLERIAVAAFDALLAENAAFVVVNNKAEGSSPLSVARLAARMAGASPE